MVKLTITGFSRCLQAAQGLRGPFRFVQSEDKASQDRVSEHFGSEGEMERMVASMNIINTIWASACLEAVPKNTQSFYFLSISQEERKDTVVMIRSTTLYLNRKGPQEALNLGSAETASPH